MNSRAKILIVDDLKGVRVVLSRMLRSIGYTEFEEASSAREGFEKLSAASTQPFDLILCDLEMPESSGLELLKRIRSDSRFRDIPFILMTIETDATFLIQLMQQGASATLSKPFHETALQERLSFALLGSGL